MRTPLSRLAATVAAGALSLACALPALAAGPLRGQVLEVRDAEVYTYLRLKTDQGETWAAIERAPLKVGAQVTIHQPSVMRGFQSKALGRTFDQIVFGSLVDPASPGAGTGAGGHGGPARGMAAAPAAPVPRLAKASGADARTVAEVVGSKGSLKDRPVTLHVQVVKANLGIMGKNWYHVQDGSGQPGSNDILVASKDTAAVGDVLTVKGVVRNDVSLGSGYRYDIMVDDARLQK